MTAILRLGLGAIGLLLQPPTVLSNNIHSATAIGVNLKAFWQVDVRVLNER
jgi:hypothetical protein